MCFLLDIHYAEKIRKAKKQFWNGCFLAFLFNHTLLDQVRLCVTTLFARLILCDYKKLNHFLWSSIHPGLSHRWHNDVWLTPEHLSRIWDSSKTIQTGDATISLIIFPEYSSIEYVCRQTPRIEKQSTGMRLTVFLYSISYQTFLTYLATTTRTYVILS